MNCAGTPDNLRARREIMWGSARTNQSTRRAAATTSASRSQPIIADAAASVGAKVSNTKERLLASGQLPQAGVVTATSAQTLPL